MKKRINKGFGGLSFKCSIINLVPDYSGWVFCRVVLFQSRKLPSIIYGDK